MVVCSRIVIEHQLALCSSERRICAHALIESRHLTSEVLEELLRHVVHSVLVERLQLHSAELVLLVSGACLLCHAVSHESVPEVLCVAVAECLHQFQCALATLAEQFKLLKPRLQFFHQKQVFAVALHCALRLLHAVELAIEVVVSLLREVGKSEGVSLPRLGTAISCLCIARVDGEGAVSLVSLRGEVNQTALPVVDSIVVGYVPVVVSHTVERELRSLAVLHRIRQYARSHLICDVGFQTVCRALHDDVAGIVGNGEVPPVVSRALDTRVDEVESLLGEVRANHSTCPKHLYLRVELVAVYGERTIWSWFSPKLRVVGRADNERSNVALSLHEFLGESVYESHLLAWVSALTVDIVEVDGE